MTATPKWFKPVGAVALLWNLVGVFAFVADLRLTPADIARLTPAQQALYAARPGWSVAATGIAVCAGALGSIGLIIGKRWAHLLFVLSLIGVLLQDVWLFGASASAAQAGATAAILQILVLVIAFALVLLASRARRNGWIS